MFQRPSRSRQAGFIRKSGTSKPENQDLRACQYSSSSLNSQQQFSPFKVESPQPISKILQHNKVVSFAPPQQHMTSKQRSTRNFGEYPSTRHYPSEIVARRPIEQKQRKRTRKHISDEVQVNKPLHMKNNWFQSEKLQDFSNYFKDDAHKDPPKVHSNLVAGIKKQKETKKYKGNKHYIYEENYQKLSYNSSFCNLEECERSSLIITESIEQIQYIQSQPPQIKLSLAESFNLHCHRMKERLERERIKFSKSIRKAQRDQSRDYQKDQSRDYQKDQSRDNLRIHSRDNSRIHSRDNSRIHSRTHSIGQQENRPLNKKISNETSDTRMHTNPDHKNRPPLHPKSKDAQKLQPKDVGTNKQNEGYIINQMGMGTKITRPSIQSQTTKFFIPVQTSRPKPITHREAYQHSLKKWKELPEVVAKEREKEKEQRMRERIIKMKAHSIEVRRKLKR